MTSLACADILAGRAPADTPITVKGWVRTRRDSKAGISLMVSACISNAVLWPVTARPPWSPPPRNRR